MLKKEKELAKKEVDRREKLPEKQKNKQTCRRLTGEEEAELIELLWASPEVERLDKKDKSEFQININKKISILSRAVSFPVSCCLFTRSTPPPALASILLFCNSSIICLLVFLIFFSFNKLKL